MSREVLPWKDVAAAGNSGYRAQDRYGLLWDLPVLFARRLGAKELCDAGIKIDVSPLILNYLPNTPAYPECKQDRIASNWENQGVGGSIPPLGTIRINKLGQDEPVLLSLGNQ